MSPVEYQAKLAEIMVRCSHQHLQRWRGQWACPGCATVFLAVGPGLDQ